MTERATLPRSGSAVRKVGRKETAPKPRIRLVLELPAGGDLAELRRFLKQLARSYSLRCVRVERAAPLVDAGGAGDPETGAHPPRPRRASPAARQRAAGPVPAEVNP